MAAWMLPAAIGGSALLGFLGQKDANATARQVANTPQQTANVENRQGSYVPHQMANPLFGYAGGIGQQMGQTPTPYFPGMGYVGPSGPTQQGVSMGMGALPYYGQAAGASAAGAPFFGQAANISAAAAPYMVDAARTGLGNFNFLSNAADVGRNPYVQGILDTNRTEVNQALTEDWLPALDTGFSRTGAGALGGSRANIGRGLAVERAAEALSQANRQTLMDAYGQGLGAQQNALGSLGGLQQGMLRPGAAYGQAGAFAGDQANAYGRAGAFMGQGGQTALGLGQGVESYQQQALQDAMNRFNYQYQEPWQRMGNIQSALGILQPLGVSYENMAGSGNTSGSPMATSALLRTQSPVTGALGGALGGVQLAGALGLLNQPKVSAGQVGNMYSNAMVQNPQNFGTFGAYF